MDWKYESLTNAEFRLEDSRSVALTQHIDGIVGALMNGNVSDP